jgi:hypothetical protein
MPQLTVDIADDLYEELQAVVQRRDMPFEDILDMALERFLAHDAHVRQLREAMGDICDDPTAYSDAPKTGLSRAQRRKLLRDIPPLDPPLSQTVIEDREDRI